MLRTLLLSILCTKQAVDGGSRLLSNVCRRRRLTPLLLVVASCGGMGSLGVPRVFLSKTCLCYVIKQQYYSVHIYIYVFRRFM